MRLCLFTSLLLLSIAPVCAQPQEGSPQEKQAAACLGCNARRTNVTATPGPRQLKGLRWKTRLGKSLLSPPIVDEGLVIIGGEGFVCALGVADGTHRWLFDPHAAVQGAVAVTAEAIFVGNADGTLCAIDKRGTKKLWRCEMGQGEDIYSSPCVVDDIVYFASRTWLCAVNAADGKIRWRLKIGNGCSPAVGNDKICLFESPQRLNIVDARKGTLDWSVQNPLFPCVQDFVPAVDQGHVFAQHMSGLRVFDLATKAVVWSYEQDSFGFCAPAVSGKHILLSQGKGGLVALERNNGRIRWQWDRTIVSVTPTVSGGLLYVGGMDTRINKHYLYCAHEDNGAILWQFEVSGAIHSPPAVGDGAVFVTCDDGWVYAVE